METSLDIGKEFRHRYKLSIIPISRGQTVVNGSGKPETLIHASTYTRTNKAIKMGITPANDSRCLVMGSTILPLLEADDIDLELAIKQCKDRGVYLWNDAKEAAHQSLATVGLIKEDNPSLIVVDTTGLEKDYDPAWTADDADDPISYVHRGSIGQERVECICRLHEDLLPDVGAVMCPLVNGPDGNCPSIDATNPETYDALHNPDNWVCSCKPGRINDAIQDKILEELSRKERK